MEKTELFIENRIRWRASQHNLPNNSVFLFENLDSKVQKQYSKYFSTEESGKLLLIFTDSNENWTALCTKMIFGFNGKNINSVKLNSIKSVDSKNRKLEMSKTPQERKEINKKNERELSIVEFNNEETVFITKKGSDFFSLWNIILMISRLNDKIVK